MLHGDEIGVIAEWRYVVLAKFDRVDYLNFLDEVLCISTGGMVANGIIHIFNGGNSIILRIHGKWGLLTL